MRSRMRTLITFLVAGNFSVTAFADTCPTQLYLNKEGYFSSTEKPGWKAYKPSPPDTTIDTKEFGGVVFSPEHGRIACVYRDNHKQWIALISDQKHAYSQDGLNVNLWKYDAQRKLFFCGTPEHTREECQFGDKT